MRKFLRIHCEKIKDAIGLVFILGLFAGGIAGCCHIVNSLDRDFAEKKRFEESQTNESQITEVDVAYIDRNVIHVIHDKKREVTCWRSDNTIVCLPDRDIKR